MGLDFNNSEAHWSYSGFNRFREQLASAIGMNYNEMVGLGGDKPWPEAKGIIPLLNHSDCDGELSVTEMKEIAPKMLEIVANWPDSYDKQQAIILGNDMLTCVKQRKKLKFC